ncbi:MAG: AzlD domain-containing protein [Pseudomonadota bacterium]
MTWDAAKIWALIVMTGIGTYLIRFSFLGLIGDKEMPQVVLKLLRYTPVAVLPGLVAPLVIEGSAPLGEPEKLIAAAATVLIGWRTKNLLAAIAAGAAAMYGIGYVSS